LQEKAPLGPVLPMTPAPTKLRFFASGNYKQGKGGSCSKSNHCLQRNAREGFVVLRALSQYPADCNHAGGCERGLTSIGPTANSWQFVCTRRRDEPWFSSIPNKIDEVFYRWTITALARLVKSTREPFPQVILPLGPLSYTKRLLEDARLFAPFRISPDKTGYSLVIHLLLYLLVRIKESAVQVGLMF
jgi:hypothetical protein